ncbi:MAG: EAL domain-containing protein [Acidimicrobiales bacterium]|jgi:diguanylate cyclase (GGDEF)-like protein
MDEVRQLRQPELHPYLTRRPLPLPRPSRGEQGLAARASAQLGGRRPFAGSAWKAFSVVVLVSGLAISTISAFAWYAYISSLRRQAVAASLDNVKSIVGTSLERDNDLAATVNALVATHPELTNRSLATVLAKLNAPERYPGSIAFTYVENVGTAGLRSFETVTERDPPLGVPTAASLPVTSSLNGQKGYCLTRLAAVELLPTQSVIEDLLLSWVSPYLSAHFNFCASSFQGLLDTSARTGRSLVASVLNLVKPPPGMPAVPPQLHAYIADLPIFIEISPVFTGTGIPTTARARAQELTGWTMAIFDADKILGPALATGDGVSLVLAHSSPGDRPTELARAGQPQVGVAVKELTFPADPGWVIDVAMDPRGSGPSPLTQGLAVLFGSLALTLLLVMLLRLLIRSRRSALELVEERTAELRHQALYDSLTGLPNRLLVNQRVQELVARAREQGPPIAVFFIDLDDFKRVNDTLGHEAGDMLLRAVADRLSAAVRDSDTVGRLGGDEFVVLFAGSYSDEGLKTVAERLLSALREPFRLQVTNKINLSTSASIGIATGMRDNPEELLRDADTAMYRAKVMGKNCYVIFRQEMHDLVKDQLTLEMDLTEAFTDEQFFLVYQPIVNLDTGHPRGVEALLRWQHPERGVVGPADFISVLETSNLIVEVGRFVLMEACRQARLWHDLGHPVGVSVNVGARQLHHDVLVDHVREALELAALEPSYLTVEVTETILMLDPKATARCLSALSDLGVRIAIDDFGTGYASLAYLREFPVDILKIDRSFVAQLATSTGTNFLDALIQLGKSLGLLTIAEGIEETPQLRHLKQEGCDQGQGFLFSKPLPAGEIEQIITGAGHFAEGVLLSTSPLASR